MSRIRLPGNEKNKKKLLLVLVIIALGILCYEGFEKMKSTNSKNEQQEEIIKPTNMEDTDSNTTSNDKEKANVDTFKINNNGIEKSNNSEKENQLYDEAYTLFFSHEYQNAIKKADTLVNEFPNNAQGYNIRGIAKSFNGDFNSGMEDIDKALSIDGNYGYARFNKALAYELHGNMEEALKWYNKDLEIEEYVWSYYGMASIYGRKGDVENTMIYLNKAIQMDKAVKEVAKNEHDFDPVRKSEEFKEAVNG